MAKKLDPYTYDKKGQLKSSGGNSGLKSGVCSVFLGAIMLITMMGLEVGKHVTNYGINYYNNGTYPAPPTLMVLCLEILNFSSIFLRLKCRAPSSCDKKSIKSSLRFLLPSIINVVNNSIYFGKIK